MRAYFYKDHFISISRLRSLLPSARRRLDELPGPSHCEGASESLRSGKGPVSAAGRAGCGGATPEPDVHQKVSAPADPTTCPNEGPVSPTSGRDCRARCFSERSTSPLFYKDHFTSISRLRSLLPSARRRLDELPGPSHREGASESLRSGKGPVAAAGLAGCARPAALPVVHQKVSAPADPTTCPNEGPVSPTSGRDCRARCFNGRSTSPLFSYAPLTPSFPAPESLTFRQKADGRASGSVPS